jgi:hypothetical protein
VFESFESEFTCFTNESRIQLWVFGGSDFSLNERMEHD